MFTLLFCSAFHFLLSHFFLLSVCGCLFAELAGVILVFISKLAATYSNILCIVAPALCVSLISRMFVNLADAGPQPMLAGGAKQDFAFGACYSLDGFLKPQFSALSGDHTPKLFD